MKLNLHIKLDGNENLDLNVIGIKKDNVYKYKENNINVVLTINSDNICMNRTCSDYDIKLIFNKNDTTLSSYTIFGGKKEFFLNTKTTKLNVLKKKVEIEYILEGNSFKYRLEEV